MKIKKGQYVHTPRFLNVRIEHVFSSRENACKRGYTEPTHFNDPEYGILGKSLGNCYMEFAAYRKENGR